jgi:hypothetical protein
MALQSDQFVGEPSSIFDHFVISSCARRNNSDEVRAGGSISSADGCGTRGGATAEGGEFTEQPIASRR